MLCIVDALPLQHHQMGLDEEHPPWGEGPEMQLLPSLLFKAPKGASSWDAAAAAPPLRSPSPALLLPAPTSALLPWPCRDVPTSPPPPPAPGALPRRSHAAALGTMPRGWCHRVLAKPPCSSCPLGTGGGRPPLRRPTGGGTARCWPSSVPPRAALSPSITGHGFLSPYGSFLILLFCFFIY